MCSTSGTSPQGQRSSAATPAPSHGSRWSGEEVTSDLSFGDPRLREGSKAIDAGRVIPNITDGFRGQAPDLGAIEHGDPLPQYGPRPEGE